VKKKMPKFDINRFDIKGEAQRGLHAYVGAADLAIEAVREYVADAQKKAQDRFEGYQKDAQKALTTAQKSVKGFELQPKALRSQASTVFVARVEELSKDAKARRAAVEERVVGLQGEATDAYEDLVKRGEKVVKRLRKETASVADPGPVKKDTGVTTTAKKATAKKATAKKAPAKKAAAKKAPAKKTTAKKATASS
jgi:heparin binding hemagglutinin HbhA